MPRTYSSPLREAEARATRARIVDAAGELFAADGYASTALRTIAERAGVSVPTVTLAGPKWSLLLAAFEKALAGDEGTHSLSERPAVAQIMGDPDTARAVRSYVAFLTEANARCARLWHTMHAAADGDAEVRAQVQALDERRRDDLRLAAGWMLQRGLIGVGDLDRAGAVLAFLTSPDAYLHFVGAAGWTDEAYAQWLETGLLGVATRPLPRPSSQRRRGTAS